MRKLPRLYHGDPPDARCYYQNGATRFFHAPHQQNLFLRHYAPETPDLLSVLLVCRTLAMPGDWHRKINPDHLAITFVHSGKTLIRIGEEAFEVGEGELFLLPPGLDYEFGTTEKAVRSGIIVQGSLVEPILLNLHGKYVFAKEEAAFAESRFEPFFQEKDMGEHARAVWAFDLLSSLKSRDMPVPVPVPLQNVIRTMKKHLGQPLLLEDLARSGGMSSRTLTRLFRHHLHISPHQYLVRLRMKRACQMLAWEEFSVKEIAISVGYPNALNFSTEFRRLLGCSPTRFRRQRGQGIVRELEALPDLPSSAGDLVI